MYKEFPDAMFWRNLERHLKSGGIQHWSNSKNHRGHKPGSRSVFVRKEKSLSRMKLEKYLQSSCWCSLSYLMQWWLKSCCGRQKNKSFGFIRNLAIFLASKFSKTTITCVKSPPSMSFQIVFCCNCNWNKEVQGESELSKKKSEYYLFLVFFRQLSNSE